MTFSPSESNVPTLIKSAKGHLVILIVVAPVVAFSTTLTRMHTTALRSTLSR
nr:MAG TPA: hypothetical protein [Caudoviricetes sp.]